MDGKLPRRALLAGALAASAAPRSWARAGTGAKPRVVVVGGGFGGATCARSLTGLGLHVTLVEPQAVFTACPHSNAVIAGLAEIEGQRFRYDGLRRGGVAVVRQRATGLDPAARTVTLESGDKLTYDRAVLAPGIDMRFDALPGYDAAAAEVLPHAWKAGAQTLLLRRQLEAMEDGGAVLISVPANPFRCPPGPYERASLIAHYLKTRKPKSKVIILDAKDAFSKQKLFEAAWKSLYGDMIEWVGLSAGGKVTEVHRAGRELVTEFGRHKGAVVNVIPPQRAAQIAQTAGVVDATGWCPVDPVTFEARGVPGVHLIGDAIIAGGMPKSAFSANVQAKACADAVAALLQGGRPLTPKLINTCYSLVAPDYGISIAGVYSPANGLFTDVPGAGGVSPLDAPRETRVQEAAFADAWFNTITEDVFG